MAAYSLLAPNLISSNPKALNLSSSSLFFSKPTNHLSFSSSNSHFLPVLRKGRGLDLSIVRRVAAYSEVNDEEEEEEVSFSPDLKLFVGNLPFSVDSSELAELFQNAGTVEKVEVIYDKQSGNSRGFGFVTMSTVEEVETAAQQFNGYELDGRALRVNSGPPPRRDEFPSRGFRSGESGGGFDAGNSRGFRSGGSGGGFDAGNSRSFRSGGGGGSSDAGNRLYVGNLSWGVDNVALESLFREQGNVTDARVVYDRESGRSRGFGFVTYNTAAEANNAISSLDGSDLDGRSIRVSMAEARPPRREF